MLEVSLWSFHINWHGENSNQPYTCLRCRPSISDKSAINSPKRVAALKRCTTKVRRTPSTWSSAGRTSTQVWPTRRAPSTEWPASTYSLSSIFCTILYFPAIILCPWTQNALTDLCLKFALCTLYVHFSQKMCIHIFVFNILISCVDTRATTTWWSRARRKSAPSANRSSRKSKRNTRGWKTHGSCTASIGRRCANTWSISFRNSNTCPNSTWWTVCSRISPFCR